MSFLLLLPSVYLLLLFKFEVFMMVKMLITVFWVEMQCGLVKSKAVLLLTMKAPGGRGGTAPTYS
jgi:hypothetical protein